MSGVVQALLAAYGAAKDAYFKYVTLLLPGNGTNGAQNNTFLDSSTNNFTITRNGNTTQGTFTPYGSNWSNYFDGTGDYLNPPNDSANSFGTGDFTVEAWIYPTSTSSASIVSNRGAGGADTVLTCAFSTANGLFLHTQNTAVLNTGTNVTANTWQHVAFVRASGTLKIYLNGVSVGSASMTQNLSSTNALYIAKDGTKNDGGETGLFSGYISNTRIVKGTAVYTANFTPPTAPLAAITNTSLLTCQSNRFVDNSANNFAITVNGDTSVQRFSPFSPTTPYAAGTIGGSGYFDGSGDSLTAANNAAFRIGSGDFTVEGWVLFSNSGSTEAIISQFNSGGTGPGWTIYKKTTDVIEFYGGSGTITVTGTTALSARSWNHFAVVRNGSTITIYVNGVAGGTGTNSSFTDETTTALYVGARADGVPMTGYVSDARIVKGTAVYTANFTPPTAPLTAITNTSLLLNFTNGGIIDNAMMNDLETVGNAQISTSVSKFGGGSIAFDGTGDYLTTYGTPQFAFGAGDFTIECWVYFNSLTQYDCIIDFRPSGTNGAYPCIFVDTSNTLVYYVGGANRITSSAVSTGQWYHLAVSRTGTSTKMFLNGVQTGSTYTDSNSYLVGNPLTIGGLGYNSPGTYALDGYIDDLRITKGIARYTTSFTPQRSQWQDQ